MKLSAIKALLPTLDQLTFVVEGGEEVPAHFHVTEVGQIQRDFIDCGGVVRHEKFVNFQLWFAKDTDHRLEPGKLSKIITLSEEQLGLQDAEVEVEYQGATIGRFDLEFDATKSLFVLRNKQTACLAEDACGIPAEKIKKPLSSLNVISCAPGSGCC